MDHGRIIGVFGGCHHDGGLISNSIMVFTTWPWRWLRPMEVSTHSSVGFIYQDGYREIFEAREGKSWQGPIPVSKVQDWVSRDPKRRRFTMYDIPSDIIDPGTAAMRYTFCMRMLGVWTYSTIQLPRMGLRKYLPFLPLNTTHNEVVCSEAATIVLDPPCHILCIAGVRNPDRVTPWLFELAMKEICAKERKKAQAASAAYED